MRRLLKAIAVGSLSLMLVGSPPPAARAQQQPAGPHYFFVALLDLGPKYDRALPLMAQPGIRDHAAYISQLEKDGKLLVGGPFVETPGSLTPTGAMMLILADSLEDARKMMQADPAQAGGMLTTVEIKPFVMTGGSWRR